MFQHAAVAEINEQRRLAIAQHIDIAGVGPSEQVGLRPGVRLGKARGHEWAATDAKRSEQSDGLPFMAREAGMK